MNQNFLMKMKKMKIILILLKLTIIYYKAIILLINIKKIIGNFINFLNFYINYYINIIISIYEE